jgi:hypothetical protein
MLQPTERGAEAPQKQRRKPPSAGRGRKKGEVNKVTRDVREIIARVAEKNAGKIDAWLSRIGRRNPAKAMDLYLRMLEYHIPKLTRIETVRPPTDAGRVIDSSLLTAEQREQLRQMILGQQQPELLEQIPTNVLEPVGLDDAQVIDSGEEHESTQAVNVTDDR